MIIEITDKNFQSEVIESKIPVLLDFWAEWCGPCRMLAPTVEAISNERDNLKVGKINVDIEQKLAMSFGIDSIPTLIIVKDGNIAGKLVGYNSKAITEAFIDKTI